MNVSSGGVWQKTKFCGAVHAGFMQCSAPVGSRAQETCKIAAMEAPIELDAIDRRILRALQVDGRLTYDALAAEAGLSSSAVLRRVRRLEEAGVIASYVALVAPERIGLGLTAYINVRLEKQTDNPLRNPRDLFRAAVQTWPEVVECAALTGEMDYLLRVLVQDMQHYARFISDTLLMHPSVQDCKTSFVLERLKNTTAVPV
jgi:Lrp/AsnC family transcriptional regulator, leucine-responsive regulatory protein